MQALLPEGWKRPKGYANGVARECGRQIFVSGMIGWDAQERFHSDDFAAQARQALQNIVAVLAAGDAEPRHIVRHDLVRDPTSANTSPRCPRWARPSAS